LNLKVQFVGKSLMIIFIDLKNVAAELEIWIKSSFVLKLSFYNDSEKHNKMTTIQIKSM